jgi:hypothetical protein
VLKIFDIVVDSYYMACASLQGAKCKISVTNTKIDNIKRVQALASLLASLHASNASKGWQDVAPHLVGASIFLYDH